MKVIYIDEYGETLYRCENDNVPALGDTVSMDDEDWRIKSRTFVPMTNEVVIELTQNQVKSKAPTEDGDRLKEMQRAIVDVNKRQDLQEKRTKSLREQAMSIRQHIRRNQPKPKDTQ